MYPDYQGEPIIFECLRCGLCCRELINVPKGYAKSISLTKEEAKLFPSENVSPSLGCGTSGFNVNIAKYQINTEPCPHFNDENKECRIYEKRPLACRRFPLMHSNSDTVTNLAEGVDCKFIEELEAKLGYALNFTFTPDTFIAPDCWASLREEIRMNMINMIDAQSPGMNVYSYDLKKGGWYRV